MRKRGGRVLKIIGVAADTPAGKSGGESVILVSNLAGLKVPAPPTTGTVVLTSTNGVMTWQPPAP